MSAMFSPFSHGRTVFLDLPDDMSVLPSVSNGRYTHSYPSRALEGLLLKRTLTILQGRVNMAKIPFKDASKIL